MFLPALAALIAAAPAPPLPFEEVLAETTRSGTPIVLDVFTTWCKPCRMMDAKVFPHPRVVKALAGLKLVKYDAERGPGVAVARRFDINTYPTVLVLTPDGHVAWKIHSQDVDGFIEELEKGLPLARVRVRAEPPADAPAAEWLLAGRALKHTEPLRALELFARAQRADPKNEARIGGRAAAEAALVQAALAATRERGRAFSAFLEAWPMAVEAPAFLHALAELTAKAGLPRADLERARAAVTNAWTSADDTEGLNDLVYLLLELGDLGGAARVAARLEALAPDNAACLDTVAEVAFQAGDRDRATALSRRAVQLAKGDQQLEENLRRFEKDSPELPGLSAAPELDQEDVLTERRHLDAHALQAQLKSACAEQRSAEVWVRLYPARGKVARAAAFDPLAPPALLRCLEKAAVGLDYSPQLEATFTDVAVAYGKRAKH
ncbi:MAG: thioredoxin family protein [Myxococcales bacterium]|nr:thioredoxin family protein [Myxococcales bacterium]